MTAAARERIEKAPIGAWFRPSDFGGGNSAEQILSRIARDPNSSVVRAAKGLYYKSGPPDPFFGKRLPSPTETAMQVVKGQGVGPAGVAAAAFLGLSTQVMPRPTLTVVGTPPKGVKGVEWQVRKNPARAQLNFAEVAVLEMLTIYPYGTEADWTAVVARVDDLRRNNKISLGRLSKAVSSERRKPELRQNFDRLLSEMMV